MEERFYLVFINMIAIRIPKNIKIYIYNDFIKIKSPFNTIIKKKSSFIKFKQKNNKLYLINRKKLKQSLFFLSLLSKTILTLSKGYYKILIIEGVGYKINIEDSLLKFKLGFSHEILYKLPKNVKAFFKAPNFLTLYGENIQQISQIAAEIRNLRPPEPYKGKGIRYKDEIIIKKIGKIS